MTSKDSKTPVEEGIRTSCGATMRPGDRAFNFYDMKAGVIGKLDSYAQPDTMRGQNSSTPVSEWTNYWFDFLQDDGTSTTLDGSRITTLGTAERQGWYTAPELYTFRVAPRFVEDHADRGCMESTLSTWKLVDGGRKAECSFTAGDVVELLSDAEHYATFQGIDRQENLGLCASAAATVRAMRKRFTVAQLAAWRAS